MFRHRQTLRRWAAAVLLVWLFGVVSGVAHACLAPALAAGAGPLDERAQAGHVTCHPGHAADRAADVDHDADGSLPPQQAAAADCHGALPQPNCQALCDKASVSMLPLKSVLDDLQALALPPLVVTATPPVPAPVPLRVWLPRRDGVAEPPLIIAFLRLAL